MIGAPGGGFISTGGAPGAGVGIGPSGPSPIIGGTGGAPGGIGGSPGTGGGSGGGEIGAGGGSFGVGATTIGKLKM